LGRRLTSERMRSDNLARSRVRAEFVCHQAIDKGVDLNG
jgi:hypothetical protein